MLCRCEHTLSNSVTEANALTAAARSFTVADESLTQLNLPHFTENLHAAINCFSHAIRVSHVHCLWLLFFSGWRWGGHNGQPTEVEKWTWVWIMDGVGIMDMGRVEFGNFPVNLF